MGQHTCRDHALTQITQITSMRKCHRSKRWPRTRPWRLRPPRRAPDPMDIRAPASSPASVAAPASALPPRCMRVRRSIRETWLHCRLSAANPTAIRSGSAASTTIGSYQVRSCQAAQPSDHPNYSASLSTAMASISTSAPLGMLLPPKATRAGLTEPMNTLAYSPSISLKSSTFFM